MPQIVENLGQARGMASGLAARAIVTQKESIKLSSLLAMVQKSINALGRSTQVIVQSNPEVGAKIKPNADTAISIAKGYLAFLEQEILQRTPITIKSAVVFAKGTEAIKANFKLLDQLIPELALLLEQREDQLATKMTTLALIVAIFTFIALYLFAGFYNSFNTAILSIEEASAKLAKPEFV